MTALEISYVGYKEHKYLLTDRLNESMGPWVDTSIWWDVEEEGKDVDDDDDDGCDKILIESFLHARYFSKCFLFI